MGRKILWVCDGNSARSIMAEVYMNHVSGDEWQSFSAGANPHSQTNPFAIQTLYNAGFAVDTEQVFPKNIKEFMHSSAYEMDVVITLCDLARDNICPAALPGSPRIWHWPFEDPAAIDGGYAVKGAVFFDSFTATRDAIDALLDGEDGEAIGERLKAHHLRIDA